MTTAAEAVLERLASLAVALATSLSTDGQSVARRGPVGYVDRARNSTPFARVPTRVATTLSGSAPVADTLGLG